MRIARFYAVLILFILSRTAGGQTSLLAPTPPMGWNSWDAYAQNITEAQVKENADFMAKNLKQYGWNYVVIDEGWYLPDPGPSTEVNKGFVMDADGRFLPSVSRFPSAAHDVGFKAMG